MEDFVYVPGGDDTFVALSRTPKGRLFKKHILSTGPLYYPGVKGGKIDIDEKFLDTLVKNFNDHVVSHVQTPVVDENNRHSEDPLRNIGEVVDLKVEDGKAYAYIDVRDEEAAPKMGKTLLGASAMLALDWKNNKTNERVGPALIHTAITNNAHLNDLEDFEEVLSMSSVSDSNSNKAVLLTADNPSKESAMDLDEMIAALRDEHGIDVPALQLSASKAEEFAKLSSALQEKLTSSEVLKLSNSDDEASAEDIIAAVTSVVETNVSLSAKVDTLVEESARAKAEKRIDDLVSGGFIAPVKREAHLDLLLSNPETFEKLIPEKPIVALSAENGNEFKEADHDLDVSSEIARLSADAASQGLSVIA